MDGQDEPIRVVLGEFPVEDAGRKMLLTRIDEAFSDYSQEAEQLSVLLAAARDPSSWTSYHDLLKQRTVELVAHEKYRKLMEELFSLITPPEPQQRPQSSVN
jgi:hypothetical protein